jgi:hypothetical protein
MLEKRTNKQQKNKWIRSVGSALPNFFLEIEKLTLKTKEKKPM